ncbi:hypothetical protein [Streptomyces sp. NPDC000880]
MRAMSGVGSVAAGLAAVVLVSGCAGGGDEPDAEPSTPVTSSTPPPVEVPAGPTYPDTPEGDFDRMADGKGWMVDSLYEGSAARFVHAICDSIPAGGNERPAPQGLAEGGNFDGDGKAILQAGIPEFCPQHEGVLKQAVSGDYDRWFADGTYVVEAKLGPSDPETGEHGITPGTYRTTDKVEDCYWERTSKSGEILDNQFATAAQEITVTVRSGDGSFTTQGCGTWRPVK